MTLALVLAAGCDRHPDLIVRELPVPVSTPAPAPAPVPTAPAPTTPTASVPPDAVWTVNDAWSVLHAGDVDLDGQPDLLFARSTSVVVVDDPLAGGAPPPPAALGFDVQAAPIAAAGDVDQDGRADWWALGTDGRARLVSGSGPAEIGGAELGFVRSSEYWPPLSFVTGDLDDNGVADLIATDRDQLAVFGDPPSGDGVRTLTISDAYTGGYLYTYGPKCGLASDLDGDGVTDLAAWIGWTQGYDDWYSGMPDGDVYVFTGLGGVTGDLHLEDADIRLFGAAVHTEPMDWDGDGATDLALFGDASGYDGYAPTLPIVEVVAGPVVDGVDATLDATATVLVDLPGEPRANPYTSVLPDRGSHILLPGAGSPGDLDGDGADDLVVSQWAGSTWVVRGGTGGVSYASDALLLTVPLQSRVARGHGDFDGDGRDDLVLFVEAITGPGSYVGVWLGSAL